MPQYIKLPDGRYYPANYGETPLATLNAAIAKYPELFYVNNLEKCGDESQYAPISLPNNEYACGYIAYSSVNVKPSPTSDTIKSTSLADASVAAIIAVVIGFGLSAYLYYIFKKYEKNKVKNSLIWIGIISFGFGVASVANELLGYFMMGLPIREQKIFQPLLVNIVTLPFLIWMLIILFKEKVEPKIVDSLLQSSEDNSTSDGSINNESAKSDLAGSLKGNAGADKEKLLRSWELALEEFDSPKRKAGLWAKLYAESDGEENRAKAQYLKIRSKEISD